VFYIYIERPAGHRISILDLLWMQGFHCVATQ
jgi:hypothetical protein